MTLSTKPISCVVSILSLAPQFNPHRRAYQTQQSQQCPPRQVADYQNYSRPNRDQGQAQTPSAGRGQQSGNTGRPMSSNPGMRALRNELHSVLSRIIIIKLNLTVLNIRNKLVLTTVKQRTTRTLIRKIITTTSVIKRDSLTKNTMRKNSVVPRRIPATHTTVNLPPTLKHLSRPKMSKPSFKDT